MYDYEKQLNRPTRLKLPDLQRNSRLKHVIFAQQFDRELLEELADTASMIRALSNSQDTSDFLRGLLRDKRAMLYFTQTSTRTFLSFTAACQLLGMNTAEIRDPRLSSEYKGESPIDSMRMFSSYFDLVIMRSGEPSFAERCAYLMNDLDSFNQRTVPIINAGSGADEHPTQALLDMYTIQRSLAFEGPRDSSAGTRLQELQTRHPYLRPGIKGKTFVFSGDIGRGRTVRSLSALLSYYEDVTMRFVAPNHPTLRLQQDMRDRLVAAGVTVSEHTRLSEVIADADLLYMTRVQTEHNKDDAEGGLTAALDAAEYKLTKALLSSMREYTPILHPFPRKDEIPADLDDDPRVMYFHQARNGMWVRAALLAHLFDVDKKIASRYAEETRDYHAYNEGVLR